MNNKIVMKNKLEIRKIEETTNSIFDNLHKLIEIDETATLLINILEKIKDEKNYDILKDYLFVKNNKVNKMKKQIEINIESYNLGVYDLFSNMIYFLGEGYKNSMENIYSKLSPKQKSIVNVIKKYDKVSIDLLKKELNISPQQLYNLTHTKEFENVVNIYRGISKKDICYSVKYTTRQYLKKIELSNQNNIFKNKFSEYSSLNNKINIVIEGGRYYEKLNKSLSFNPEFY